jgi:hypothetical protein
VGDKVGNVWDSITDVLGNLTDSITGPLRDFVRDFGDNPMTKIITEIPKNLVGKIWDKAKDAIGDFFSGLIPGRDDDPNSLQTAIDANANGDVRETVKQVFAGKGWGSGAAWRAVESIIQSESSWNPRAQNPTSTASGLFQHINATWRANRRPLVNEARMRDANVLEQAHAGRNYIERRYGTPEAAWAYWRANRHYSEGGEVKGDTGEAGTSAEAPTLYDTGGWLPPGITTVLNASGKPEPVLTSAMWEELVNARDGDDDPANWGIQQLHLHEVQADLSEAIDTVNHEVRKMQRGGRYVGAGAGGN